MSSSELLDHALDVREILRVFKVDSLQAQGSVHEVDVTILESGKHETMLGIDGVRGGTGERCDGSRRSDGENLAASNCHRFRPWLLLVHGIDPGIDHNQVGRLQFVGCRNPRHNAEQDWTKKTETNSKHAAHIPGLLPYISEKQSAARR